MSAQALTRRSFAAGLSLAGAVPRADVALAQPRRTEIDVAAARCSAARHALDTALEAYERAQPSLP